MNPEAFDILISYLEKLGAPYSLPPDWVLSTDLDVLRDLPTAAARKRWLHKAKREATRRNLQARVDEISEALECEDELAVSVLHEAFPQDILQFPYLTLSKRNAWIAKVSRVVARVEDFPDKENPTIYIVSGASGRFFKIGFTNSIEDRLRSLQTASPEPLHLHLAIPGSLDKERELHRRFAVHRAQGEWFKRCEPILQFIALHRA
jgi:Meiotically up-regulated gene 113